MQGNYIEVGARFTISDRYWILTMPSSWLVEKIGCNARHEGWKDEGWKDEHFFFSIFFVAPPLNLIDDEFSMIIALK